MLGSDFEVNAWSRFWRWSLIKICVWTCDMTQFFTLERWTQPSGPLCLWQCYHDRGTKKLARTSCWYVPGRIVRMSSAILGQMEDLLGISSMCNSSSRHLLYFKIARISLGWPRSYPLHNDKKSKKLCRTSCWNVPRTCSKDVLRTSFRDVLRVVVTK